MTTQLSFGKALRRFRRLTGIKQGHFAELLHVSQGCVSRWESGTHEPDGPRRDRVLAFIAANADSRVDAALKRLVETSAAPVHMICDATHRLLAASPSRAASWNVTIDYYVGTSLWPFATPEIIEAESNLRQSDWFERCYQMLRFKTGGNASVDVPVLPGTVQWETIPLGDGRVGRLTMTCG